jgi:hypothetical protein
MADLDLRLRLYISGEALLLSIAVRALKAGKFS